MTKLKTAVVGTGGIAKQHAAAITENPDLELVAGIDVNRDRREAFVARWGATAYESLGECLRLADVDVVYVLTPPGFRKQYAVEAIEAGCHVLCEKPLAITLDDGEAIVDAAERAGIVAATGFNMRFRAGYERLRNVVAAGTLGRPYHFWCHRFGMGAGGTGTVDNRNWRTDPSTLCGITVESLSHDIDMMRWIMNDEVVAVTGITYGTVAELPGYDNNSHVLMELKRGGSAVITASWSSRIGFNSRGVLGDKGTAYVGGSDVGNNGIWSSREFHVKTDDDEYESVTMLHDDLDEKSYQAETDDFVNAIRTGSKPRSSVTDGLATLRVSQAILESAKKRTTVELS